MHTVGLRTVTLLRRKILSTLELNGSTTEQSKAAHAVLHLGCVQVLCKAAGVLPGRTAHPAWTHSLQHITAQMLSAPVHSAARSPTAGDAEMQ